MKSKVKNNLWSKYYKNGEEDFVVPEGSIYEYFCEKTKDYSNLIALNYFGKTITFESLREKIDICANSLKSHGVRKGEAVTICMPNTPEALIAFYAINKIGAIANMIHPLSSEEEIKKSILDTKSVLAFIINLRYKEFINIIDETSLYKVVVVSAKDSMPPLMGLGYLVTQEFKMDLSKSNESFIFWSDFFERGRNYNKEVLVKTEKNEAALYLHSGGTTGIPKNIVLTNGNVNSILGQARYVFPKLGKDDTVLAILPMFHCFGLVVSICGPLSLGATIVLIPQFDAKRFDKLIRKYKPTVLIGVPTLYEALVTNAYMMNVDMSMVRYVISGGDSLSLERNKIFNDFLHEHGCKAKVMQGYGMTETTGPSCIGALGADKLGSVGIPLPGNYIKIVDPETKEEQKVGEIGEICLSGYNVMKEYLDNKIETDNMIVVDKDNRRWVHTGDLGYLDKDGVLFFVQRLKRMLIVSGYNVYPSYLEEIISKHPMVKMCGVIGVPHPYKIQVPKAYIVLEDGVKNADALISLQSYCKKNLAKYMIPKYFEIRDELPKTMIGKIDYKLLEAENKK